MPPDRPPLDALERCAPYVRLVHDFLTPRGHVQPPRVINDHALIYFHRGDGRFFSGGDELPIRPGRLFLIPPGAPHRFACPPTGRQHMFNIHFDPVMRPDSRDLLRHHHQQVPRAADLDAIDVFPGPQPRGIQAFDLRDRAGYARLFHATLAHFPAEDRGDLLRIRAAMLELLAWLHAAVAVGAIGEAQPEALLQARAFIRERFHEPLRLDAIAIRFGLGRTAFAVGFRRQFGVAPIAYLRRLRIEHAKVLLAAEGLPPKAVAGRVGFGGVHHFTRAFTQAVGVPPAAYQNGVRPRTKRQNRNTERQRNGGG